MKIKTRCDNCGKIYNMASEYTGRTAQCRRCQHHFIMNPYDPAAEILPDRPQAAPAPPQAPPAAYPPPVFHTQPAGGPGPGQYPMADQTILPNAAAYARDYAPQPGPSAYPTPQAAAYAPQPEFQTRPAPLGADRTQTVLCLKCGHSVEIPTPTRNMKVACQACGAKIAVGPEKKAGREKSSRKSLLLFLFLLLILAGILFAGPIVWPDIFPDLIGDLLPG